MGSAAIPLGAVGDRRPQMDQRAGVMVTALFMIALLVASPIVMVIRGQAAAGGGFEITIDTRVRFNRQLDGDSVEQHRVPPLSPVTMTVTATITDGQANNATLVDYFPSSWTIIDNGGGTVSPHDQTYNKIEWSVGTLNNESISKSYVIKSPQPIIPSTEYYFHSELTYDGGSAANDNWMVTVADPDYTYVATETVDEGVSAVVGEIGGRTPTIFTENSTHYVYETNWGVYIFSKTLPLVSEYRNGDVKSSYSTFWLETSTVVFPLNFVVTADENTYVVSMDVRRGLKKVGTLTQTWDFNRADKPKISVGLERYEDWGDFRIVWAVAGAYLNVGNEEGRSHVSCDGTLKLVKEDVRAELGSSEGDWSEWVIADWSDEGAAELWSGRANVLGTEVTGILVKFGLNDNEIDPVIISDSEVTSTLALGYPYQRKLWYAQDRYWLFYADGDNMQYRVSETGVEWSDNFKIRDNDSEVSRVIDGTRFGVWVDGENVHYVFTEQQLGCEDNLWYRKGTLNTDNTITWLAAEQKVLDGTTNDENENFCYPFITVDKNGFPWIAFENIKATSSTTKMVMVITSTTQDGTWTTTDGFPNVAIASAADATYEWYFPTILPLDNGNMWVVAGQNDCYTKYRVWDALSSNWWTETTIYDSWVDDGYKYSMISERDNVYIAYVVSPSYYVYYGYTSESAGRIRVLVGLDNENKLGGLTEIFAPTDFTRIPAPTMSYDNVGNRLFVVWENSPDNDTFYANSYDFEENTLGENGIMRLFVDENGLNSSDLIMSSYENCGTDKIGLAWVSNRSSPYSIMFDNLNLLDLPPVIPTPPILSSPIQNDNIYTTTPLFEWNDAPGATSYRIELDNDADFSSPLENATVDATVNYYQLPPENAMDNSVFGVQYYWRVWGINENGETASAANMIYCRTQGDEPIWRALLDNQARAAVVSDDGAYTAVQTSSSVYLFDNDNTPVWQFDQIQATDIGIANLDMIWDSLDMTWDGSYIIASGREPQSTLRKTYVWTNADNTPVWEDSSNGTTNVRYVSVSRHPTDNATYFLKAYGESGSGMIYFFDNDDNVPIWIFNTGDYSDSPYCGTVSDEGNLVAFAGTAGIRFVLGNGDNSILWSYFHSAGYVRCLDISDNSFYIAVGAGSSQVELFDNEDNHNRILLGGQFGITYPYQCKIGENDNEGWIVYGSNDNTVPIYPLDNTSAITGPIWSFQTGGNVYTVDISDNDRVVVAGGADNKVYVFSEDNDNTLLWSFDIGNQIQSVDISPDNNFIVVASDDNYVYFFGAPAGAAPPPDWNQTESWTGTVTSPANWNQVESWSGTVTSPANWNQVESWTGTVTIPVEFVCTVNTDGGGDYLTLSAWEAAIDCDLTAATTKVIAGSLTRGAFADGVAVTQTTSGATATMLHDTATQILLISITGTPNATDTWYPTADGNDTTNAWTPTNAGNSAIARVNCSGATVDTTGFGISGWTTNAANYIDIRGNNTTGKWNTSAYRLEYTTGESYASGITVSEDYVRITNLQLKVTTTYTNCQAISLYGDQIKFSKSIVVGSESGSGTFRGLIRNETDTGTNYIYNNIVYDTPSGVGIQVWTGTGYIYNNTVHNCSTGIGRSNGTLTSTNNLVKCYGENNTFADFGGAQTQSYNTSSDNTASGTGSRTSQTFTFVNEDGDDFHLASTDAGAKDFGVSDPGSGLFTDDIDGDTRSGTWDIGADECPPTWQQIESWTGTVTSPAAANWNQVESWTGTVTAPANWNQVESWTGTVTAPANWNQVESWTGTVTAPANWNQVETWSGTVTAPANWNQVESWTGTVTAPANWNQVESWTGTVTAPANWNQVESWSGTVTAPIAWQLIESWSGTITAPAAWQLTESWSGTVTAPTTEGVTVPPGWILVGTLEAGSLYTFDLTDYGTPVTYVTITTTEDVSNAMLYIGALGAAPAGTSPPILPTYSYFELSTNIDEKISGATISFRVSRHWVELYDIDDQTVTLCHYSGGWQELSTQHTGSDAGYFHYKAYSTGFTWFVIVGEEEAAPPTVIPLPAAPTQLPTPSAAPSEFFAVLSMAGVLAGFSIAYGLIRPSKVYLMLKQLERAVVGPRHKRVKWPFAKPPMGAHKQVSRADLATLRRLERIMREKKATREKREKAEEEAWET